MTGYRSKDLYAAKQGHTRSSPNHASMCAPSLAHLVLAPAPDVAAEGELLLVELVAGEHVVELVHRKVDDLAQRERDPDLAGLALVTRLTNPAEYRICW